MQGYNSEIGSMCIKLNFKTHYMDSKVLKFELYNMIFYQSLHQDMYKIYSEHRMFPEALR